MRDYQEFDWLVLVPRDPEEPTKGERGVIGLHDSGYRYIALVGVRLREGAEPERVELGQWHDHLLLHGPANIDVTKKGEIRLCPWFGEGHGRGPFKRGAWLVSGPPYLSSAEAYANEPESAAETIRVMHRVRGL